MDEHTDRRRHPRYEVEVRVHVAQLGEVAGALTRDVSGGGLFIETSMPYPVGSHVPLRIIDPCSSQQIATLCQVVRHVRDDGDAQIGLGLQFVHLDEELDSKLRGFLGGISQMEAASQVIDVDPTEIRPCGETDKLELDPAHALLQIIPLDSVPSFKKDVDLTELTPLQLHVACLVDGERTTETITQLSGLSLFESVSSLKELWDRQLLDVSLDLSGLLAANGSTTLTPDDDDAQRAFADQRARELLAEAVRAERAGRIAEAIHDLEQALALKPSNAADLHARLVSICIGSLDDIPLARQHARALVERFPQYTDGQKLLADVDKAEASLTSQLETAKAKPKPRHTRRAISRGALAVTAAAVVLTLLGWNVWQLFGPHGPQPEIVAPVTLRAIIPATSAQIASGCLYVRVNQAWAKLSAAERTTSLQQLATWAKKKHKAKEVVVSDDRPVLLGRAFKGMVRLY